MTIEVVLSAERMWTSHGDTPRLLFRLTFARNEFDLSSIVRNGRWTPIDFDLMFGFRPFRIGWKKIWLNRPKSPEAS